MGALQPSCYDWSDHLAASVVTHTPLSLAATQALSAAFLPAKVLELRIILAQGSHYELAIYPIISKAAINLEPLECSGCLPSRKPAMVLRAMRRCSVVTARASTSDASTQEWVDWQEMRALGCTWAIAAPLACMDPSCERLLGAVLAGGNGGVGLGINPEWFREWSCEIAQCIAHASVSVMESSLDMLRLIFPPQVVETLIYNAVSPTLGAGEAERLAQALGAAAASANGVQMTAAGWLRGTGADEDATAAQTEASTDAHDQLQSCLTDLMTREQQRKRNRLSVHTAAAAAAAAADDEDSTSAAAEEGDALRIRGGTSVQSPEPVSPFAPFAAHPVPFSPSLPSTSQRSSSDSENPPSSTGGGSTKAGARSISVSQQLSMPSSHVAAAVLREASIQSHKSAMTPSSDITNVSPANSEVAGYEDLLNEDALARASRRPSYCLDRAQSREDSALESTGEENPGSPRGAHRAALAAAEADKRKESPKNGGKVVVFLPGGEYTVKDKAEFEGAVAGSSSGTVSGSGTGRSARNALPDGHQDKAGEVSHHAVSSSSQDHSYTKPHSHSLSTISEGASQHDGMTSRSLSSPLQSMPSQGGGSVNLDQEWDLAFSDARVEQRFEDYVNPRLVAAEGFTGGATAAGSAAAMAVNYSAAAAVAAHLIPLVVLLALPLVGALGFPQLWVQNRGFVVPPLRLLAALIVGPWFAGAGLGAAQAIPLGLLALAHPLSLRFHIPLQLLCLWSSVNSGIWEFILGFAVPTLVIYVVERRLRREFALQAQAQHAQQQQHHD